MDDVIRFEQVQRQVYQKHWLEDIAAAQESRRRTNQHEVFEITDDEELSKILDSVSCY